MKIKGKIKWNWKEIGGIDINLNRNITLSQKLYINWLLHGFLLHVMTYLLIHWTILLFSFFVSLFSFMSLAGASRWWDRPKVRNFRLIFIWLYVNETFAEGPSGNLHTSGHLSRLWKQNNDSNHPRLYNLQQKRGEKSGISTFNYPKVVNQVFYLPDLITQSGSFFIRRAQTSNQRSGSLSTQWPRLSGAGPEGSCRKCKLINERLNYD